MRQSADSNSRKTSWYPADCSTGTNGCIRENSGQVTGIISEAALSFIVQEPSGIIDVSSPTSFRSSLRM
jgi:hypothetical protein